MQVSQGHQSLSDNLPRPEAQQSERICLQQLSEQPVESYC
jgi:hypothetical protein